MRQTLEERIQNLKNDLNAVILVHSYQRPEVQDIGDYVGDSLGLCIEASRTDAEVIIFCGVHFMAESAKLINPGKTVILPDYNAGCPMADMASGEDLRKLKMEHPEALVVCYVNSTAEVKAESDICCTSSNATQVVESLPRDREIIFVPDKYLGGYTAQQTGREMILWQGYCPTHQKILPEDIQKRREEHPGAVVLVHPECTAPVIQEADHVGSTGFIFNYCCDSDEKVFIIGTEHGIIHRLKKYNPEKTFVPATDRALCPNMKLTTLSSVVRSMERLETKVEIDGDIADKAFKPVERMLALSGQEVSRR